MALGTTIGASGYLADTKSEWTVSASVVSSWMTLIDATGADDADASNITDPTAEIILSTRHLLNTGNVGNHLALRLVYDDGISAVTSPVVAVFGRTNSTGLWERLRTLGDSRTSTLTVDTTNDCSDGTLNYTDVSLEDNVFDLSGCNEILVGIETALSATGTVTTAYIQGKIL